MEANDIDPALFTEFSNLNVLDESPDTNIDKAKLKSYSVGSLALQNSSLNDNTSIGKVYSENNILTKQKLNPLADNQSVNSNVSAHISNNIKNNNTNNTNNTMDTNNMNNNTNNNTNNTNINTNTNTIINNNNNNNICNNNKNSENHPLETHYKNVHFEPQPNGNDIKSLKFSTAANQYNPTHLKKLSSSSTFFTNDSLKSSSDQPNIMVKYTIYESKFKWYILASNARESKFRCLEIDLEASSKGNGLVVYEEDDVTKTYTRQETAQNLTALENAYKSAGLPFNKLISTWGILGFIRFTLNYYYMCVITKRSQIALLGGHYIYHIDNTELIPVLFSGSIKKPHRNSEEARFLSSLQHLDLGKTFYFSYSYDITNTLQKNLIKIRQHATPEDAMPQRHKQLSDFNEMFVWNHHLLVPILSVSKAPFLWCFPIIHGFIDQAKISVFGRSIYLTLIARRSHYFAGARFLKRGVNDQGYVANEVETEQIVADMLLSSFHDPREGQFSSGRYSSFVQHRGSIPLFWAQDVNGITPKPPIELTVVDPFFQAAALHFDDMFRRYGTPIIVLNLIKTRERSPRETILLNEFEQCLAYLNMFLPKEARIRYTSWDMSRAAKSHDQEVIEYLECYADKVLHMVGIFHNGGVGDNVSKNICKDIGTERTLTIQSGVCRTNCIDCLDRTNAAQFVIGKKALAYQLKALGIIDSPEVVKYDSDVVNLLTNMFHDHGDTIALQYGGSHLVNTMETYRKLNQWSSNSRDLIESIKRFYSNSFIDAQRQEAINLFLGNYIWEKGKVMLWDMPSDYYLHHVSSTKINSKRRSYQKWWTPDNIIPWSIPKELVQECTSKELVVKAIHDNRNGKTTEHKIWKHHQKVTNDDYWVEYYRPKALSSLHFMFAFNIESTQRYISYFMTHPNSKIDFSPFAVRTGEDSSSNVSSQSNKNSPVPSQVSSPSRVIKELIHENPCSTPTNSNFNEKSSLIQQNSNITAHESKRALAKTTSTLSPSLLKYLPSINTNDNIATKKKSNINSSNVHLSVSSTFDNNLNALDLLNNLKEKHNLKEAPDDFIFSGETSDSSKGREKKINFIKSNATKHRKQILKNMKIGQNIRNVSKHLLHSGVLNNDKVEKLNNKTDFSAKNSNTVFEWNTNNSVESKKEGYSSFEDYSKRPLQSSNDKSKNYLNKSFTGNNNGNSIQNRSLEQAIYFSLCPSVDQAEKREYERYIKHPQSLGLSVISDLTEYVKTEEKKHPEFTKYLDTIQMKKNFVQKITQEDINIFEKYLATASSLSLVENEADLEERKYKLYNQWLKNKIVTSKIKM